MKKRKKPYKGPRKKKTIHNHSNTPNLDKIRDKAKFVDPQGNEIPHVKTSKGCYLLDPTGLLCSSCGIPHGLRDEDAGSDREELKLCVKCFSESCTHEVYTLYSNFIKQCVRCGRRVSLRPLDIEDA